MFKIYVIRFDGSKDLIDEVDDKETALEIEKELMYFDDVKSIIIENMEEIKMKKIEKENAFESMVKIQDLEQKLVSAFNDFAKHEQDKFDENEIVKDHIINVLNDVLNDYDLKVEEK